MRLESLKVVNITGVFLTPLNQLPVSSKEIGTFVVDAEKDPTPLSLEAPNLKVIIFPNLKREFIFENQRVLVNDKSEISSKKLQIVEDFKNLFEKNLLDFSQLSAIGFNFDAIANNDGSFAPGDLLGEKISNIATITNAGADVSFVKDGYKYNFQIKALDGEKYVVHLNAHLEKKFDDLSSLSEMLLQQYKEFENIVSKI